MARLYGTFVLLFLLLLATVGCTTAISPSSAITGDATRQAKVLATDEVVSIRLVNPNIEAAPVRMDVPRAYLASQAYYTDERSVASDGIITIDGSVRVAFAVADGSPAQGRDVGSGVVIRASLELGREYAIRDFFRTPARNNIKPTGRQEYRLENLVRTTGQLKDSYWYSNGSGSEYGPIFIKCSEVPRDPNCVVHLQPKPHLMVLIIGFPRAEVPNWSLHRATIAELVRSLIVQDTEAL